MQCHGNCLDHCVWGIELTHRKLMGICRNQEYYKISFKIGETSTHVLLKKSALNESSPAFFPALRVLMLITISSKVISKVS